MLLPKRRGFYGLYLEISTVAQRPSNSKCTLLLFVPLRIWDTHVTSAIQKTEMVQRRAARFVVRNYSRVDGTVTNILNELNWSSLQERRKKSRLAIMCKIHANDVAIPIPEYVQRQTINSTWKYHPLKFRPMKVSTNTAISLYRTISDWNSLPSSVICHRFEYHREFQNCIV